MSEAALLAFSDIPGLASALPERSDTGMDAALGAFREVPTAPSRPGSTEAEPAGRAEPAEPAEVGESSVSLASVSEGRALPDTEMDAALSAFQENPTAPSWPGSTEAEPAGRAEPTGSEHAGSQLPPAGSEQPHAGSGIVPTPLVVDGHVDQIHPQAMQAFAADIAAEEAAPASPESRLEHQRKEALKEAMKLVEILPDRCITVAGGPGSSSSVSDDEHKRAAANYIASQGGLTADKTKALRLLVQKDLPMHESAVHRTRTSPWPISMADMHESFVWFGQQGYPTAAARVPRALAFLQEIGLERLITGMNMSMFNTTAVRVPSRSGSSGGSKARAAPPPLAVLNLAKAASGQAPGPADSGTEPLEAPPPGLGSAVLAKVRELYIMLLLFCRGADLHGSKIEEDAAFEGAVCLINPLSAKSDRADVRLLAPALDLATGGSLSWYRGFFDFRREMKTCVVGFDGNDVLRAAGPLQKCPPSKKALKSLADVQPVALGASLEDLSDWDLTGTHATRNLAGVITANLGWSNVISDIAGDWATPREEEGGSGAPKRRRRRKVAFGTRQQHYTPTSPALQMEVRDKLLHAIAAGLQHFGHDNITWDTTWLDIFPLQPPDALQEFYYFRVPQQGQ